MSNRNVGPRSGTGEREGAYQWPALAAEIGVDLSAWRGEQIEIAAQPSVAGELLFFLFVDVVGTVIDETTATAGAPPALAKVPEAPAWIGGARGGSVLVSVPQSRDRVILKLLPETAAQRVTVRQAEG